MRSGLRLLSSLVVLVFLSVFSTTTFAVVHTAAVPKARVTSRVDNSKRVTLHGHVPSALRKAKDMGRLDPKTPAEHLILVLKSDENQKRELRRTIDEQQDQRTANYHQWLTPEEFGAHFGVHDDDIAQVKAWLVSQGFKVEDVSKSKRLIHFSGTTGQIESAFQTEMHNVAMPNGENHVSNTLDISVPEALSSVIAGVPTLNNFFSKPHHSAFKKLSQIRKGPKFSFPGDGGALCGTAANDDCFIGPGDFATIYNTAPLLAAGINGAGVSIGIVGRSDILMSDVQTYRQMFNLPVNDPVFIHAGQDNGILAGDDGESDLDVEISGGIAPNATVDFVIGTPTFLVDGITNSIQYLVENNLTDIISTSYGDCESNEGAGGNLFNSQMFEQAAAQGISVFIADGDNGPAECDDSNDNFEALGYAASAEASTPYGVSVGGTMFDEATNSAAYWAPTSNSITGNQALGYIPEAPWNEAKGTDIVEVPAADVSNDLSGLWSGSGGISAYYLAPSWQSGPGVPTSDPVLTQGGNWLSVAVTNAGAGYIAAPSVTFVGETCVSNPVTATTTLGTGAQAGQVVAINYNFGTQGGTTRTGRGFNCTIPGTVTFTAAPAGGTTATGTTTLAQMQNMLPIIPNVPHRLTPDVSLNAAAEHDGSVFCSEGVCAIDPTGAISDLGIVGGTSVAAPSMAGIQALIDQANGGRQGMPGYIYYSLAKAQNTASCNSSTPPLAGSNCAFQDITVGDTFICGTSACTNVASKIGFPATPGYDLATGLGSVNAANLSAQWKNVSFNASATTLNLSQTTFAHGTPITLSGTVTGSASPTGDVVIIVSQGVIGDTVNVNTGALNGPLAFTTLAGGTYSTVLNNLPGGTYFVTARYGGDDNSGSSTSTSIAVTVAPENSGFTLVASSLNGSTCVTTPTGTATYGADVFIDAQVTAASGAGAPTGTVTISDNGTPIATGLTLDPNGHAFLLSGPISTSNCLTQYNFSNTPTFTGGTHNLTATYSGDSSTNAMSATPIALVVTPISPTLALAAGASQITSGFSEQLTATFGGLTTLTGASVGTLPPSGTVTFTDTTTAAVLGVATVTSTTITTINAQTTAFTAVAALQTSGITATGANSITATYNGDTNWNPISSTAVTVTVGTFANATTTTVTNAGTGTTGNPTTLGGRPTLTATIGVASGTAPTTGAVTFYDGTTVLGTGNVGATHTATLRLGSTPAFIAGAHNITATYGGVVTTFAPSASAVFVQNVTPGTVTNVLTTKTVGKAGQSYYLIADITPSTTSTTYQPTANVQFFDGATALGSAPLNSISAANGGFAIYEASLSVTTLTAGTHSITAVYPGDANYPSTPSNAMSVFVGGNPTLTWTVPAAITYPAPLTTTQLNATDTIPGTFAYTPKVGTVLTPGNQTLSVTFTAADNTDFPTPQTTTVPLTVNQAATSLAVTNVNPSTEVYGQDAPVTITAVLSWTGTGAVPTGAVTISSNGPNAIGATSCGAAVSNTITCTATYTPTAADGAGIYTISAAYAGDTNYTASGGTGAFIILTASTNVTVQSSQNPSVFGQPVTFTATVTGQFGQIKGRTGSLVKGQIKPLDVNGGTLTWSANTGCSPTLVSGGSAICITSGLAPGSDTITASYSDVNHTAGSGNVVQTVNQAATTLNVTSVNPSTETFGLDQTVAITAVLTWTGNGIAPTGAVTIGGNGPSAYSATSCGAAVSHTITCTATYTPTASDVPSLYTMSAAFAGDTNYTASSSLQSNNFSITAASAGTSVTSNLNPSVFGQSVTFTATISSASGQVRRALVKGRFHSLDITGTVTWSANTECASGPVTGGIATCTTTSLLAGTDTVTASYSGDGDHNPSSGSVNQVVNQASQTITFPTIPNQVVGAVVTLNATTTSSLAVTYGVISGSATLSGNALTITGVGPVTVQASQAGNANYSAATPVSQGFTVSKGSQTITFSTPAPATAVYNSSFTVVATASSGLPVTFVSSGACTNVGATFTITAGAGTCSVKASQAGNANYLAATTVSETTHAAKAPQTVTFTGAPASATYQSTFTVDATSSAPITPSITASGACSISGTTVTMTSGTGTCTMTATFAASSLYLAGSAKQTTAAAKAVATVTWATPAPIVYGTPLSATQLDATANTGGSFTYTPAAGKVLVAGTYTLAAAFKPSNASDFTTATGNTTLVVNPVGTSTAITSNLPNPSLAGKTVTMHFTVTPATSFKAPTGSVTVTASTGETCTATLGGGSGTCKVIFSAAGTRTLTATYAGDANNSPSTSAGVTQTVN